MLKYVLKLTYWNCSKQLNNEHKSLLELDTNYILIYYLINASNVKDNYKLLLLL